MRNSRPLNLLLILIISLVARQASGEQKQDSLLRILKTSGYDTTRVNVLNKLSVEYRNEDYKKTMSYAEEALKLAEKIKYKKGMAASLTNIGMAYFRQHDYIKSREYLDRSYKILEELNDDIGIGNYYNATGDIFLQQGLYDNATKYYNQALGIFTKSNVLTGIVRCNNNIGYTFYLREKYARAME